MIRLLLVSTIFVVGCSSHDVINYDGRVHRVLGAGFDENKVFSRDDRIQFFEDCLTSTSYGASEKNRCNYQLASYLLECISGYACESDRRRALSIAKNLYKDEVYGAAYYHGNDNTDDYTYREDYIDLLARSYQAMGDYQNAYETLYNVHEKTNILQHYSKITIEMEESIKCCETGSKNYFQLLDLYEKSKSAGEHKIANKVLAETKHDADKGDATARSILIQMYESAGKIKEAEKYTLACLSDEYDGFQGYVYSPLMTCNLFIASFYNRHGLYNEGFRRGKEIFDVYGFYGINLAYHYHYGMGVAQDKAKAAYFYELSAMDVIPDWEGLGAAAYIYATADGVDRNCLKARYFIERLFYLNKILEKDAYGKEHEKTIENIRLKDNSCGI